MGVVWRCIPAVVAVYVATGTKPTKPQRGAQHVHHPDQHPDQHPDHATTTHLAVAAVVGQVRRDAAQHLGARPCRQGVQWAPVGRERDAARDEGEERLEAARPRLHVAEEELAAAFLVVFGRLVVVFMVAWFVWLGAGCLCRCGL